MDDTTTLQDMDDYEISSFNTTINDTLSLTINDPNDLHYPWRHIPYFYLHTSTYLITLIFGVMGNVAVIILMAGDRKSHNTTNMFLVSLSVADLLMLVLCVPLKTVYFFVVLWDSGGTACRLASYVMMLSFTASALNLTAVSLERFIVIVLPMRSRSLCTMSNCRRSVLVVWVTSLILASPVVGVMRMDPVVFTDPSRTVRVTAYYCQETDSLAFLAYQLSVLFVVPALLMIIFYAAVIRELWRSTRNIRVLTNTDTARGRRRRNRAESYYLQVRSGEGPYSGRSLISSTARDGRAMGGDSAYNSSASLYVPYPCSRSRTPSPGGRNVPRRSRDNGEDVKKARKQVIKMLIVVVVLFLLCWGPMISMGVCINLGLRQFNEVFYNFNIIFILLPFVHCCINPIIYCFMSKNFRRSVKRSVPCCFCFCSSSSSSSSCCCICCPRPRFCCCCCCPRHPPQTALLSRVVTSSQSPEVPSRVTDLETVSSM